MTAIYEPEAAKVATAGDIVVATIAVFILTTAIMLNIGYHWGWYTGCNDARHEAVTTGAARWTDGKDGRPEFRWNTVTDRPLGKK